MQQRQNQQERDCDRRFDVLVHAWKNGVAGETVDASELEALEVRLAELEKEKARGALD